LVRVAAALGSMCLVAAAAQAFPASQSHLRHLPSADTFPIMLFFEPGISDIPQSARPIANRALAEAIEKDGWQVTIAPFVGPAAEADAAAVAEERAQKLVEFLTANGIADSRIEARPVRPTQVEDYEIEFAAQRVEIRIERDETARVAEMQ